VWRTVYVTMLLLLMCTAWMIVAGTQIIRNVGDMARFGALLFQILAPLQLAVLLFLAAIAAASAVAVEKDRKTLVLLLMTRLTNSELVVGKLLASLLNVLTMLLAGLPIFMWIVLLGGTSFEQVGWTFAVTLVTVLAAGALGSTVALWREKTFQALALVALAIVFWIGAWEAVALVNFRVAGVEAAQLAGAASPLRAILAASSPTVEVTWPRDVLPYLATAFVATALLSGIGIWRVRRWNPSRDIHPRSQALAEEEQWDAVEAAPVVRPVHIDARASAPATRSRRVWDNPVLWREMCTWAHGKKIVAIRVAYWLLAAAVAYLLYSNFGAATASGLGGLSIAPAFKLLAPLMLLSLVLINSLAVTSMSGERDGKALDLLLVTDLTPKEFLFGKLGGLLYVALDTILVPLALGAYVTLRGGMTWENFGYLVVGYLVVVVFVSMLGLHCGMIYANSRQAIVTSLGTVFFLFVGVITMMVMMVSFAGSVEAQLTPFLACIVGGGVGLYATLGSRNPSPAIALASGVLPLAMFFSITSLLLGRYLSVALVVVATYAFATTAMMIPALGEFNISVGRARPAEEE